MLIRVHHMIFVDFSNCTFNVTTSKSVIILDSNLVSEMFVWKFESTFDWWHSKWPRLIGTKRWRSVSGVKFWPSHLRGLWFVTVCAHCSLRFVLCVFWISLLLFSVLGVCWCCCLLVVFLSLHHPLLLGNFPEITFDNKSGCELVSTGSIRKTCFLL